MGDFPAEWAIIGRRMGDSFAEWAMLAAEWAIFRPNGRREFKKKLRRMGDVSIFFQNGMDVLAGLQARSIQRRRMGDDRTSRVGRHMQGVPVPKKGHQAI